MFGSEIPPRPKENKEIPRETIIAPAVETLFVYTTEHSPWPEDIRQNAELAEQVRERRELLDALDAAFADWPMKENIETAIESGTVSAEQVRDMYEKLSTFMRAETANGRIVLYVPFETLPSNDWHPSDETLAASVEQFRSTYMTTWHELMKIQNSRRNFHDGDSTRHEDETGEFAQVTKAAHLIPELVRKGMLRVSEARKMIEESIGPVLRQSIADTFSYMHAEGMLSETDKNDMAESDDMLVRNMVKILEAEVPETPVAANPIDAETLQNLSHENQAVDPNDMRAKWEARREEQASLRESSRAIGLGIESASITVEDIEEALADSENIFKTVAIIRGIRTAIEQNPSLYPTFEQTLKNLWAKGELRVIDELETLWSRLVNAGILDGKDVEALGIHVETFEKEFSSASPLVQEDVRSIGTSAESIASNENVRQFLYPTSIVYGSKVKGYAERGADTDIAVFVKPGHVLEERAKIQEMIKETFGDRAMEFWLEEQGDGLRVKDFSDPDTQMGDSTLTSVLFEGVWAGADAATRELHEKLLASYMKNTSPEKRTAWLGQMERDTLQYRLMHRGYHRHHPEQHDNSPHGSDMDMDSAFWDPGYRRLATKLFVKKVFLPKLEK